MIKFWKSIFFNPIIYYLLLIIILVFFTGYFIPVFYSIGKVGLIVIITVSFFDLIVLYQPSDTKKIIAERKLPERFSNGDNNTININVTNNYRINLKSEIIDEVPIEFQVRDFTINTTLQKVNTQEFTYELRPTKRGEYVFNNIHVLVSTPIGVFKRRFTFNLKQSVAVYPSFLQMRKFELLAIINKLSIAGIKKVRKISQQSEFDRIRDYIQGDDFRTVNWKATARKGQLMVNHYLEDQSQQVYCILDMGRTMKMPFEEMALLDYAINSALVTSNIALTKYDSVGLLTFSNELHTFLKANNRGNHIQKILQTLYNQTTNFKEPDYNWLYTYIKYNIKQRSLFLFYTNFESMVSLKRNLNSLKRISKHHLLVVIIFENTELSTLTEEVPKKTEDIYTHTIASQLMFEKKLIIKELEKNGILAILSKPENLSVSVLNKYIEIKAMNMH